MREMQTLEYAFLVQELQSLVGKRFSKIYDIGEHKLRIKAGGSDIIITLGKHMFVATKIPESTTLSNFSQKVRKELEGKHIRKIYLLNNDRIVVFEFTDHRLIFEMFGKGNAVLARGETILACYRIEQWKDRILKPKEQYHSPQPPPLQLKQCLSSRYITSDMAKLPYGLLYVKEALYSCKIDEKKPGNTLTEKERACIEAALKKIHKQAKPLIFYQDNQAVDFGLNSFSAYSKYTTKEASSFSQAIESCVLAEPPPKDERLEKLKRRLQKQKQTLSKLIQEEKTAKEKGDNLYTHYQKIEEALALAKSQNWDKLKALYPNLKINKKRKEITFTLAQK